MPKIKRILCPVDFSSASDRAATYAVGLARGHGAKVKFLHVVAPVIPAIYEYPLNAAQAIDLEQKDAELQFKKLLSKLHLTAKDAASEIQVGRPFPQIEETIENYKPDLVVVGTQGRRGFERWVMGSITERLLRRSTVPVLTISASGKARDFAGSFRNVAVTTDFSADTREALKFAASIARKNNSRITLIHVLDEVRAWTSAEYRRELTQVVRPKLSRLLTGLEDLKVATRIEAGTPYAMILELLRKLKVDLVVMNTHGKGMLERAVVGSTTDRVVRAADCAVILIPPKQTGRERRPRQNTGR